MERFRRFVDALVRWLKAGEPAGLLATRVGRAVAGLLLALALATVIGLIALWPQGGSTFENEFVVKGTEQAEVTSVSLEDGCEAFAGPGCRFVELELVDGPNDGERSSLSLPGDDELAPEVNVGDRVRVARNGLIAAVPLTTALAALLAVRVSPAHLGDEVALDHGH